MTNLKNYFSWIGKVDWVATLFLSLTPIAAIGLSLFYILTYGLSWPLVGLSVFFYYACGMSITGGYHRYFAHRTYQVKWPVKVFYVLFGAASFQESILMWATGHRFHHKYVDTDKDPYNAKRGFLYSHLLWMFQKVDPPHTTPEGQKISHDLRHDPLVAWQHKHYYGIAVIMGFGLPTLIGWSFGAPLGGFIFAGLLRMSCVHHFTFCINSLCHMIGKQSYGKENTSRDSWVMAFFTYGEGYHNFHHHFQSDYRNGIRWYDFDPTKWLIRGLSFLGLAFKLRKITPDKIIQSRVSWDLENLKAHLHEKLLPFEQKLVDLKQNIDGCASRYQILQLELKNSKKLLVEKTKDLQVELLLRDLQLARRELRIRYGHWRKTLSQLENLALLQNALPTK